MALLEDGIRAVQDTYRSMRDKVASLPADLAARGAVITRVTPAHPADQDIPKMAQEQADRVLGKRSHSPLNSTMTPIQKKGK